MHDPDRNDRLHDDGWREEDDDNGANGPFTGLANSIVILAAFGIIGYLIWRAFFS